MVDPVVYALPVLLLRPNLTPEERALALETFRPMLRRAHAFQPADT